jgi:nitrogen fixation NifU-like protein
MSDEMDNFVKNLQNKIYEDTRNTYGQATFERWLNPRYMGAINNPDGYACLTGRCGDTMEIFLRFEKGQVKEATFKTDGCASSAACGSYAAEMALGKNPDELLEITGDALLEKLGALPEDGQHCAFLAGEAIQEALNDYMTRQRKR